MPRVKLSHSPLARPDRPIYALAAKIQDSIYFPTPDLLYLVVGTVIATMMKGSPVWVVLVGPASAGKTLILDTLRRLSRVVFISMVKGTSALLSGVSKKEVLKDATGGVMRQIGKRGLLVMKDFTGMLSLNKDCLLEVMGAFREIYDGHWDRGVGTDGGKVLNWSGKMGLVTASTYAIDNYHAVIGDLGERWLYWKMDKSDGYGETLKALTTVDPGGAGDAMQQAVVEYMEEMGFWWSDEGMDRRELTRSEVNRVYALANFASAARSAVRRDGYTKEITDVSHREAPTRMSGALGQLYLGLEACGLEPKECWRIVTKTAMDSMPELRSRIIQRLRKGGAKQVDLRDELKVSAGTVRKACDDLVVHGVVEKLGKGDRFGDEMNSYRLSAWAVEQLRVGLGEG